MKVGYLGPRGTFTEEAVEVLFGDSVEHLPLHSIDEVFRAIAAGTVDKGVVPMENSIEGTVNLTQDILIFESDLVIEREIILPVDHNLLVRPGVGLPAITSVYSIPHATAQCRDFLNANVPDAVLRATNSTADAARLVSEEDPSGAAIATRLAARIYGLDVAASGIQDHQANETRFILLGRETAAPSGADKTSLVCFIDVDRPGSLLEILGHFADRSINLTKVESRPTKERLGEYCFLIDLEGHQDDAKVAEALGELRSFLPRVKILGSYPAHR